MLEALAARDELVSRLERFRWLAIEDARPTYEAALDRQRRYGLVGAERRDPGGPE